MKWATTRSNITNRCQSLKKAHLCKCCCVICTVAHHGYSSARALQLLDYGSLARRLDAGMHMLCINPNSSCNGSGRALLIPCKKHVQAQSGILDVRTLLS